MSLKDIFKGKSGKRSASLAVDRDAINAAEQRAEAEAARREAAAEANEKRRARILVVDDEQAIRSLVTSVLQELGHEVHSAPSGQEAILLAKQHRPDLVLLDLLMPGMNGIEVCRELRANPATRECRIIVVSGVDARMALEESIIAGADDFLQKPFKSLELAVRVRSMLRVTNIDDQGQRVEEYIKSLQKLRTK